MSHLVKACVTPAQPHKRSSTLTAVGQVFVTELAVETLDVAVLHRTPWLDQDMANAMRLRLGHERPAGEFRTVVCSHSLRVTAKQRNAVQNPGHVLARDAKVC